MKVRNVMDAYLDKICCLEDAAKNCENLKKAGKRIVFTNGCFDILHAGHTRYLYAARALGDHLVVGLNSDRKLGLALVKGI